MEIVVSNAKLGIPFQRQWVLDNLVGKNEWFCFADDNIQYFTAVHEPQYNEEYCKDREAFAKRADMEWVHSILNDTQRKADEIGAKFCGFAVVDNYFFREKKWRMVGHVIQKIALINNVGIRYHPNVLSMGDYYYTAENLLRYGKVLINNYLFPIAKHYQSGGIGTYEERVPKKIHDCAFLIAEYPDMFRYKVKAGCHPLAELQLRFTSEKQVLQWRKDMIAKRK
jgi:glycosyltransferase involved in cell wall biosynthesis